MTRKEQEMSDAYKKRMRLVYMMNLCDCSYPVKMYRNGSGHARSCPAHEAIMREKRGLGYE